MSSAVAAGHSQRGRFFIAAVIELPLAGRLGGGTGRDRGGLVVARIGGWVVLVPVAMAGGPVVGWRRDGQAAALTGTAVVSTRGAFAMDPFKVGDRIVRGEELRAVPARPEGEDRPVYVVVDSLGDEIHARPELMGEQTGAGELVYVASDGSLRQVWHEPSMCSIFLLGGPLDGKETRTGVWSQVFWFADSWHPTDGLNGEMEEYARTDRRDDWGRTIFEFRRRRYADEGGAWGPVP